MAEVHRQRAELGEGMIECVSAGYREGVRALRLAKPVRAPTSVLSIVYSRGSGLLNWSGRVEGDDVELCEGSPS